MGVGGASWSLDWAVGRPAEAAIAKVFAKVFAKIRQKILLCKFFGHAGRMGTSRTTSCQNFSLERPLAVPKTSKKERKTSEFFTISELSFPSFLTDFGGARLFLTSNSSSSRFFALDDQIFRPVRRLEPIFGFFTVRTSTCGEIWAPKVSISGKSRNFLGAGRNPQEMPIEAEGREDIVHRHKLYTTLARGLGGLHFDRN